MKRDTKEAAKAALRQRIADIATGAAAEDAKADEFFSNADFLSRFIPALKIVFAAQWDEKRAYLWADRNLNNFDDVNSTTEFLFTHGIRAKP